MKEIDAQLQGTDAEMIDSTLQDDGDSQTVEDNTVGNEFGLVIQKVSEIDDDQDGEDVRDKFADSETVQEDVEDTDDFDEDDYESDDFDEEDIGSIDVNDDVTETDDEEFIDEENGDYEFDTDVDLEPNNRYVGEQVETDIVEDVDVEEDNTVPDESYYDDSLANESNNEDEPIKNENNENEKNTDSVADNDKDDGTKGKVKAVHLLEHNGYRIYQSEIGYLVRTASDEGESKTNQLTNFTLEPTLLVNDKSKKEEYVVDVKYNNTVYKNRRIQVSDINSPNRLKEALGIMGLVITGSMNDYALLQMALRKQVKRTIVASEVLGLHDDGFLVPDGLITKADDIVKDTMVLMDKVRDSHSDTFATPLVEKEKWDTVVKRFFTTAPKINSQNKMLLLLGWFLSSVLKEYLFKEHNLKFPILEVYGTKGSGKTSTIVTLLKFFGHHDPKGAPTDRLFPMFKRLAMTNALAVYLDEYRETLHNAADIKRITRNSYDRRDDSRGQSSQELIKYDLLAPMIVVGEDPLMDAACQERVVAVPMRRREQHPEHFDTLTDLPNKKYFIGGYMRWLMQHKDDWDNFLGDAEKLVDCISGFPSDRVKKSAICIAFGLLMGKRLAEELDVTDFYTEQDMHESIKTLTQGNHNVYGDLAIEMMANVRDQHRKIFKPDEYKVEIVNGRMIGYFKQHPLVQSVVGQNKDSISARSLVSKLHESTEEDGFVKKVNSLKYVHGNTIRVLVIDLTQLCEEYSDEFHNDDFSGLLNDDADMF